MNRTPGKARGVLRSAPGPGTFHHARIGPSEALAGLVEHFWSVAWDLRGHPPTPRETLPHPSVHLIFERGLTRVFGIASGRFTRVLEGRGRVFGVKFRPGGFHPFFRRPISELADASIPLHAVFGDAAEGLEERVLARADDEGMIEVASRFLEAHLPPPDPEVERVAGIVARIAGDRRLTRVEALVEGGLSKRALQRLFKVYVGVSPKWVINRYRLHEALEQLAAGRPPDWATLALELGYFDQPHFIRDFKKLIGRTPAAYVRTL